MAEGGCVLSLPALAFASMTDDAWMLDAQANLATQIAAKTTLPPTMTDTLRGPRVISKRSPKRFGGIAAQRPWRRWL